MKLYQVFNGLMGMGPIFVIVIAKNEEEAKDLARGKFKETFGDRRLEPERYWRNLEVVTLSEDTSKSFVSEVEEG
ncbi:hypothetical protein ABER23_07895 [Paenibacillus lautus]|uniref:hypothetical protein n=1 Tax=Paenibacillus lautus TaxID=1401 RepID=UPI003D27AE2F